MKLCQIADIDAGYLFRTRIEQADDGLYCVIQVGDISFDKAINWDNLTRVDLDSVKCTFLLEEGDIIFKAKGDSYSAVLIDRPPQNTVASSFFFILRVHQAAVLPEYITWYLNQNPAQLHFAKFAAGTKIRHINRTNLGDLEVTVPDIETQRKIVEVDKLYRKAKQLVDEIEQKRQKLVEAVLLKHISQDRL